MSICIFGEINLNIKTSASPNAIRLINGIKNKVKVYSRPKGPTRAFVLSSSSFET